MIKISIRILICFLLLQLSVSAKTTVREVNGQWEFAIDGKPFRAKGVTWGRGVNKETIGTYMKELNFLGVNTIRLWGTNNDTKILLDSAHAYGINIMMGIWLRHGRPGMEGDDSFNYLEDEQGMEDMYKDAMTTVRQYKDHPGVLTWGVGNEVYLNIATDKEKKAYSVFLEKVCKQIKTLDPNHPITSVEAWTFGLKWWKKYVPSVDVYGINCYGAGANQLPDILAEEGIKKPYIVTEFGVSGEWDAKDDALGIKVEPTDAQKYSAISPGFNDWIYSKPTSLGGYVFHYGDGNDFGSPWLLLFHDNKYRPQFWATREAFTGEKPLNEVPVISDFKLPNGVFDAGTWVKVALNVTDKEQENISVSFHYNQRSGSRKRKSQILQLEHKGNLKEGFQIKLPEEQGAIKVYVNALDPYNNVGIASNSINVKNGDKQPNLVAKAVLPFYVYEDGYEQPYIPTAYMGNFKMMGLKMECVKEKHSGERSIKISYGDSDGWYGVACVDPPDDWGDEIGGYNVTGAKTYSFWAKSDTPGLEATIGFGLIDKDKKYPDTGKKSIKINLTTEWTEYAINVEGLDLSCIRSGLTVYSGGSGAPHTIWIDDVMFE